MNGPRYGPSEMVHLIMLSTVPKLNCLSSKNDVSSLFSLRLLQLLRCNLSYTNSWLWVTVSTHVVHFQLSNVTPRLPQLQLHTAHFPLFDHVIRAPRRQVDGQGSLSMEATAVIRWPISFYRLGFTSSSSAFLLFSSSFLRKHHSELYA